ncbi:MAG: type II toxin-antitoxin system HicA family toxin [Chloroflexi bacterium]|nr:type II toxin-antitoxin system HicA family toxin [Chloroflexota bacterium]
MSQLDKLKARISRRPPRASFNDVRTLLGAYGWTKARQSGSHVTFTKPGELPIGVPLTGGRWVSRVYIDQICQRLGL